jgi:hypothetical protein
MNREFLLPPSRDLPPERLAERREHLMSEIALRRPDSPSRRVRMVAFVAAALIVLVGTASAIGGVREFVLDRGFTGLAPVGATPSSPESGELVVHYLGRSSAHARGRFIAPLVQVWVYADGRIIWSEESSGSSTPVPEGANELVSGYLEQRLTPDGIEFLRSEVSRFFDRSPGAVETLPANYDGPGGARMTSVLALIIPDPLGSGVRWGSVELRDGDHFLGLKWAARDDHSPKLEGPIATPEQVSEVLRIDALLTDRESVLPTSAWAVRKIRAYVPSNYAVCMESAPPNDETQLLSLLPTRATDVLRGKDWTREDGEVVASPDGGGPVEVQGPSVEYCTKLTTPQAREVADALSDRDPDGANRQGQVGLTYPLAGGAHWFEGARIRFEPYFPHGQITCSACG